MSIGETTVADTLMSQTAEFAADLLVMGAYSHSRVWEFVVGGTTANVLVHSKMPVFISR